MTEIGYLAISESNWLNENLQTSESHFDKGCAIFYIFPHFNQPFPISSALKNEQLDGKTCYRIHDYRE